MHDCYSAKKIQITIIQKLPVSVIQILSVSNDKHATIIRNQVVMLEASVRALENHVIIASSPGHHEDLLHMWNGSSPISSSFSSVLSMNAATATMSPPYMDFYMERSLPRRHHTIGNIRYDSSAYKTVSFQEDEPKVERGGGAGLFRHMKQEKSDQETEFDLEEDPVHQSDENSSSVTESSSSVKESSCQIEKNSVTENVSEIAKNRSSDVENESDGSPIEDSYKPKSADTTNDDNDSAFLTTEQRDSELEDVVTSLSVERRIPITSNIFRSKSFNDMTAPKYQAEEDISWLATPSGNRRPEEPALRSKSFKDISFLNKKNRLSWEAETPGNHGSLRDLPSHLRASLASLTSLDQPSAASASISLDVSAKDLSSKLGTLSGYLELKRNSGFKTFKKYWCALDGPVLYIYGRDKDPKAKQAVHLGGYTVKVVENRSGLGASFRNEVRKKGRQFELIPPSGAKDARQFSANTKEEADTWIKHLTEATTCVCLHPDQPVENLPNGCRQVDPPEPVVSEDIVDECVTLDSEHLYFWRQNNVNNNNNNSNNNSESAVAEPSDKPELADTTNWKLVPANFFRYLSWIEGSYPKTFGC